MQLRPYQSAAVAACYDALRQRIDNPCIVIPTGGGKTPILATICRDAVSTWGGRVLVLSHVKELLAQAVEKLAAICPGVNVGVYSAGLGKRQTREPVIVAGIQSVYERATELGRFDLILVDEAHLIPDSGEGMYRTFLAESKVINPAVRVIGLTATPYRMTTGAICGPERILNHVCYEVGVKELIRDGFLCPVRTKSGRQAANLADVHIRGGEFIENELQSAMMDPAVMAAAIGEIATHTDDRRATLLFTCGLDHARAVAEELEKATGKRVECIFGDTAPAVRARFLEEFKAGQIPYLCNVNVLTTGFDAPNIDAIAMLRPTMSPGLYYQMVGRGFRLHPGKADCLVLDFGENVRRHGPVDCIRADGQAGGTGARKGEAPTKACPTCQEEVAAGYAACPVCGHEFPPREQTTGRHTTQASNAAVISDDSLIEDVEIHGVEYTLHRKKGAEDTAPPTLRAAYWLDGIGMHKVSEWVCFEHPQGSFAHSKASLWWHARSGWAMPETVERAVELATDGAVACPVKVRLRHGGRWPEIVGVELGPKPADGEYLDEPAESFVDPFEEDIPF